MRFTHLSILILTVVSLPVFLSTNAFSASEKDEPFIQAGYGFVRESHQLYAADGFNSELPSSNGARYSVYSLFPMGDVLINTKVERYGATFKDIPSITPTEVTTSTLHIKSGALFRPFHDSPNLLLGFSFYYQKRKSTETKPKQLVAEYHQAGLGIDVKHNCLDIAPKTNIETTAGFEIPTAIKEQSARTGNYYYGYNFEAGLNLTHRVASWQVLSTGLGMRYSAMNFSGYGEQGTYEGKMRQTDFWVPIEIRFVF